MFSGVLMTNARLKSIFNRARVVVSQIDIDVFASIVPLTIYSLKLGQSHVSPKDSPGSNATAN